MKRLLVIVFATMALASCKDEVEQDPVDLLTVEVINEDFLCCNLDAWMFVTNDEGEVLDLKQIKFGKIDTLRGVHSSDHVSFTLFTHPGNPGAGYYFSTYTMVAKGSRLKLGFNFPDGPGSPPFFGYANFEIKNYRGPTTSPYGLEFSDGITNGLSMGTIENGVYRIQRHLISESHTEMIAGYRDGVPVYALIKNIKSNDLIKLDYDTDFKPHEKVIDLGPNQTFGVLYGRYNTDRTPGRILGSTNPLEGSTVPRKIGYIDGFDSYYSILFNYPPGEGFEYVRNGTPVPTNFKWPSYEVTITDRNLPAPQFNTPTTFAYCSINLQGFYGPPVENVSFLWTVIGEKNADLRQQNIPGELTAKYPKLDASSLTLGSVSILVTPDTYSYQAFLADQFSGVAGKKVLSEAMRYNRF